MRPSCSAGVRPSGLLVTMPSRTWPLRPATRTMKNSSRLLAEIERNRTRGSKRALDPSRHIAYEAFVNEQLTIGEQFHQHCPQQHVIGRSEHHHRQCL